MHEADPSPLEDLLSRAEAAPAPRLGRQSAMILGALAVWFTGAVSVFLLLFETLYQYVSVAVATIPWLFPSGPGAP